MKRVELFWCTQCHVVTAQLAGSVHQVPKCQSCNDRDNVQPLVIKQTDGDTAPAFTTEGA